MRAISRLANNIRRQLDPRKESEAQRAMSGYKANTMFSSPAKTTSASIHTAMKGPLHSARVEPKPSPPSTMLDALDPVQVKLLKEECILVDEADKVVGTGSKEDCHLMSNINKGLLHRAFSVFLFNSKGELLIQQRSDAKITFPGSYTNSCCSHPLAVPTEQTEDPVQGVKVAAQRRIFAELGIPTEELPLECFHYITRIKYMAASDGMWGEHEVDYILFVKKDIKIMKPDPNEIKTIRYLKRNDIKEFVSEIEDRGEKLTPWFQLILNTFLEEWWSNLDNLKKFESHDQIHKLN
ncbi:isopentenyl-diphosphate Delta-isomerase 1 [Galendromus occidentalis]|uniref:isopentenyl-diphosphate Delta-isomerase n=1 Tax=Galendromus occidentalis TaxID=34638 RepID=A0AAJ6VWY1_9ACAR|nr:isopentenyl-diphosphate Delta-isomerase 1 [Galendromus occidentalis]